MRLVRVIDFADWREQAREQLLKKVHPDQLNWLDACDDQGWLFESEAPASVATKGTLRLPRAFVEAAAIVSRHRELARWNLLYRVAWRIENENHQLMMVDIDDDIRTIAAMRKAVERDIYHMKQFVRFRMVEVDGEQQYIAWYRPEHRTLDANAKFFMERFGGMRWAILTPDSSMYWDKKQVRFGPGVSREDAPDNDDFEALWQAYYSSIYNPARLNIGAMQAQLPVAKWVDLPEAKVIAGLVRESKSRVEEMTNRKQPISAAELVSIGPTIPQMRKNIAKCTACELCQLASGPVFGEGPERAAVVVVGEQPGDEEDRAHRPFVGPAGKVLDAAMEQAGIDRGSLYLTNAVKGFRFVQEEKRRRHLNPKPPHIAACRPWVEGEIAALRPRTIVCLGGTAAHSILGRAVKISEARGGHFDHHPSGARVIVTYHPSAALRVPDKFAREQIRRTLAEDLKMGIG